MDRNDTIIYIIFVLLLILGGTFWIFSNIKTVDNIKTAKIESSLSESRASASSAQASIVSSALGDLVIEDLEVGTGADVVEGSTVKVYYQGFLTDGTEFDGNFDFTNNVEKGSPIEFPLNGVILGWQKGIPGMKVGGIRKLTIPPALGYGSTGNASIPANSTLIFTVKVLETK